MPPVEALAKARAEAAQEARHRVEAMTATAIAREQAALSEQLDAVKRRLRRAAARVLEAIQPGQPWNSTWQQQMGRGRAAERWREALRRLGAQFPVWTAEEIQLVRAEVEKLHGKEREGLRALSELIAALEDPRWAAGETLASAGK